METNNVELLMRSINALKIDICKELKLIVIELQKLNEKNKNEEAE